MKKAVKHVGKKYKETFSRGNDGPEDHHVAGVILLMSLIIILLSGVVWLLIEENKTQEQLIEELIVQRTNDYSSYTYTFEEFSQVAGFKVRSPSELEEFLLREDFDEILNQNGVVSGKKGSGCYNDIFTKGLVCRNVVITYDASVGANVIEVGVERQVEV